MLPLLPLSGPVEAPLLLPPPPVPQPEDQLAAVPEAGLAAPAAWMAGSSEDRPEAEDHELAAAAAGLPALWMRAPASQCPSVVVKGVGRAAEEVQGEQLEAQQALEEPPQGRAEQEQLAAR